MISDLLVVGKYATLSRGRPFDFAVCLASGDAAKRSRCVRRAVGPTRRNMGVALELRKVTHLASLPNYFVYFVVKILVFYF